jgi:hypothetical protein
MLLLQRKKEETHGLARKVRHERARMLVCVSCTSDDTREYVRMQSLADCCVRASVRDCVCVCVCVCVRACVRDTRWCEPRR